MSAFKLAGLLVLVLAALAFPQVFSNPTVTTIAVFTLMYAGAATGWNILSGYTGYIALGHAAFFGAGAYALAIMCQDWNIQGDIGPFLLMPVAGLIAALVAVPLGAIALRTRRHTFVVITIAIFFIMQLLAYNLRDLTSGSQGMNLPIPSWTGGFYNLPFYYVTLAMLVLALITSWWIRRSKYGLELLAIRDDEDRARSLGVRTGPAKLIAFVLSAFFVGMMGALFAYFQASIAPPFVFDANFDIALALMGFMGGLGTLAGPVLGALIIVPAQQYFTIEYGASGWYLVLYGALFLVVILLLPEGILPTVQRRWLAWSTQARRPAEPDRPAAQQR